MLHVREDVTAVAVVICVRSLVKWDLEVEVLDVVGSFP